MGWKSLLQQRDETEILFWHRSGTLRNLNRSWTIKDTRPDCIGWHQFRIDARKAYWLKRSDTPGELTSKQLGYTIGDRFVGDYAAISSDLAICSERVFCVEPGLDRFTRVSTGRPYENGPLVYHQQEMPVGPEEDVLQAYLDRKNSVSDIKGVHPALDLAFRIESWRRDEIEKRRVEQERLRREEERRQEFAQSLGSAEGRRRVALQDFAEAAKAALAVGGAKYLDHRASHRPNETIVRYELLGRRFEVVCDTKTLQVIDAGICLTDDSTGEKGDQRFSLESLPSVIKEADAKDVLVVFRHVS